MKLTERIAKAFLKNPEKNPSAEISTQKTLADLSTDDSCTIAFFDDTHENSYSYGYDLQTNLVKQKDKIAKYRQLASNTDVAVAIDEIVNEIIFSYDDSIQIKLDVNEENEALLKALNEKFNKILKLMNVKRNLYNIVRTGYVDGQLVLLTSYDKNKEKNGLVSIKMIEPSMLFFDKEKNVFRYMNRTSTTTLDETFDKEEICKETFGLRDNGVNLSYLEYAMKPANMLKTLEDLLIPLRFSRSISRRVFNVDIGDLPGKRGAEVMREYQNKFKYKKFYNNQTGEVSNQQHITSMVEDYWFSNRSGGKGTTVDVLDESGNLGELDDIKYFVRKLYKSLKIPNSRIALGDDNSDFSYDDSRTTKEDMKFFMFISRLRQMYSTLFKEVLKREVISTGIMSANEWDDKEDHIKVVFTHENAFIEKMKLDMFMSKLDIYGTVQDYQGKLFSIETILKKIFGFTQEEMEDEFKKIKSEESNELFKNFYKEDDY